ARRPRRKSAGARRRSIASRPCATRSRTPCASRRTSCTNRAKRTAMAGEINCLMTKGLVPFVERTVGPEGLAALLPTAGRPRDYLTAEYNWIPLSLADQMVRLAMKLMNEDDQDRWARRFADDFMDWKPSREERGWAGAYTMSLGSPRAVYADTSNMLLH